MVTASKLEKDRLDKLRKLSPKEADEYIESLVLEMFKGFHDGIIDVDIDNSGVIAKLDEFETICKNETNYNNIPTVILDRQYRYLSVAYETANFLKMCKAVDSPVDINFSVNLIELEALYFDLINILGVYYANYSNYGFMEDLLMDLSDDGLAVDSDIREKYVYSVKYGFNRKLMNYLDTLIEVKVEYVLSELDKMDKLYLIDDSDEYKSHISGIIDGVHDNIRIIYTKRSDFEIEVYKQTGFINALLGMAEKTKKNDIKKKDKYLKVKNKILDLIDGNGFAELSAASFDEYKKRNPDANLDEYMKKEPKYDVRNAKFIYPDDRDYYTF